MTKPTRNIVLLVATAVILSVTATFSAPTSGTLQFSAATYRVSEDAGVAMLTVLRTRGSGPVTVHYATSDGTALAGTDYTLSEGTLTFGARETRKTFTVPLTNDTVVNGLRTVHLTLSAPTGGAALGSHSTAVLQILDDDRGGVVQFGAPTSSVSEGAGTATLTVVRTEGRAGGVTVAYATNDGTATAGADYTATAGTLTFAAGESRHTVTIPIANDALIEGDETVRVTLSSPGGGAVLGGQRTAVLTIVDDDAAVQFSQPRFRVGETGDGATVTVERVGGTAGTVMVPYATSPGTALADFNYTDVAGTLTFAAGVRTQRFTVPVLADGQVTGNKTVMLTLGTPTGAILGTPNTAVLTIVNTDSRSGPVLTGTAAAGAPLANRLIRIKDKLGAKRTWIIDSQGKYTFNVTGLTPPFLIKVEPPNVTALVPHDKPWLSARFPKAMPVSFVSQYAVPRYPFSTPRARLVADIDFNTVAVFSVGAQEGVANVHPFTDLIIKTWYEVQGTTVEAAFETTPIAPPPPTVEQLEVIESFIRDQLKIWLASNGLDPNTFDLIKTPFDANATGFDKVLELTRLAVNAQTQTTTVTIADQTTSQNTTLVTNDKVLTATTETTIQGVTSTSVASTIIPTETPVQTALKGATQLVSAIAAVLNSRGNALTATDVQAFFDASYLNNGDNAQIGAARLATNARGLSNASFNVDRILAFDEARNVFTFFSDGLAQMAGGSFFLPGTELSAKRQTDGSWRLFGNQQPEFPIVLAFKSNCPVGDPACPSGDVSKIFVKVLLARPNTVFGVSVSGTDNTNEVLTKFAGETTETLRPTPTTTLDIITDDFESDANGFVESFPPIGTVYTFNVSLIGGGSRIYTRSLDVTTDETIAITNLTGHTLADAHLNSSLVVQWTLPTSFPIQDVVFFGETASATDFCIIMPTTRPTRITTSGTIVLPSTCKGQPLDPSFPAQVLVIVFGTHGEKTLAIWTFQ